jgi:hypothetical protein
MLRAREVSVAELIDYRPPVDSLDAWTLTILLLFRQSTSHGYLGEALKRSGRHSERA